MQANKLKTVRNDVQSLRCSKPRTCCEAAKTTGRRPTSVQPPRSAGAGAHTAQDAQATVVETGCQIVTSTDDYVQSNPWRAIAIGTGIGHGRLAGRCADHG
jgi:ElaB/YqjD/DUF883 family membrane-anchored ribosome-binding protein